MIAFRRRHVFRTFHRPAWMLPAILVGLSGVVQAASPVGIGVKAGTTGLGADLTLRLASSLNLRMGYAGLALDIDPDVGSSQTDDLTVKLDLRQVPLLLDWHPSGVRFRLSAGMVYNRNQIRMRAYDGDTVRFNDVAYGVASAEGTVRFLDACPYVGIGYGNAVHPHSRWNFAFDLGLMYHGRPKIDFRATATQPERQSALDRDVEAEIDEIRETTDRLVLYPVLTLGVSFRF